MSGVYERMDQIGWTIDGDCWVWRGVITTSGYGQVYDPSSQSMVATHRVAHERWIGPIGEGLLVRHRCDNRPCMNPAHLLVGTPRDNAADAMSRGRHSSRERHGRAVMTEASVAELRELAASGVRHVDLSRKYGISQSQVTNIVRLRHWRPRGEEVVAETAGGER